MIETTARDGTDVRAIDQGHGPAIVIVHPGMDDGSSWRKVADRLAGQYRVLRLLRRQYRLDADRQRPATIADEVGDVAAVVRAVPPPRLLVGHSSGGVVALEALALLPDAFAGAVIYEAPVVTELPLGSPQAQRAARAAVAAGKPGRAIQIFLRDIVQMPPWQAAAARAVIELGSAWPGRTPRTVRLVAHQIDDTIAVSQLGNRLGAYARIRVPVLLLGGARSPAHLRDRLDALEAAIPTSTRVTMPRHGHGAQGTAPGRVTDIVEGFAASVLQRPSPRPAAQPDDPRPGPPGPP